MLGLCHIFVYVRIQKAPHYQSGEGTTVKLLFNCCPALTRKSMSVYSGAIHGSSLLSACPHQTFAGGRDDHTANVVLSVGFREGEWWHANTCYILVPTVTVLARCHTGLRFSQSHQYSVRPGETVLGRAAWVQPLCLLRLHVS